MQNSVLDFEYLQYVNTTISKEQDEDPERSLVDLVKYLNLITIVSLYTEMVLCFVMNILSLSFIIFTRSFSPINMLIINLALADMLYSSCIPFYVTQFSYESVSQTQLGCRLSFILDVTSMIVNVFTVAALTLERYFCLREKKVKIENSAKKMKIITLYIVLLWFMATGFSLPKVSSIVSVFHNDTKTYVCGSTFSPVNEEIYTISKWIIAFAFPYLIIFIFSILLLIFVRNWSNRSARLHGNSKKRIEATTQTNVDDNNKSKIGIEKVCLLRNNSNKSCNVDMIKNNDKPNEVNTVNNLTVVEAKAHAPNRNRVRLQKCSSKETRTSKIKRRTTRLVMGIIISFLCSWSPMWIFQIVLIFTESQSIILKVMSNLTMIIVYMGGVINPMLYMFLTRNFRSFFTERFKKAARL